MLELIVDDIVEPLKKKPNSKECCPCLQSLGEYWLILCSNKQCKQRWHTNCCNLPGLITEELVNNLTDNGWLCPWCFTSTYPRPKSHPVAKQASSLLSAAVTSQICDTVTNSLKEAQSMSTTITPKACDITKELNELYKSINADLTKFKMEMKEYVEGGSVREANGEEFLGSQIDNEPSFLITRSGQDPYLSFEENVLSNTELEGIMSFLQSSDDQFKDVASNRKTLYFGEYGYRYGDIKHDAAPFPEALSNLLMSVREKFPNETLNSCLISRYDAGSDFCPAHSDNEPWLDPKGNICTLSFGAQRVMRFTRPESASTTFSNDPESIDLELPHNSLLRFSRKSQEDWKHSIIPDEVVTTRRYSITLRHVKPHFINSLLVIGDSNTEPLKFGTSKGCFGAWVPGERMKAGRIKDIPAPENLYPFRNLIIHAGINDINRHNRESTKVLISNLDSKCKAIHQMFPNMRIFISLLLPTTDQQLNYRINEFNDKIQLLINSRSYLYGFIQHHNLLDHEGKLRHDFSRDYQHLKGSGICEFVNSIKAAIIHRKPGSSNTRPNGVTMQSNGSNQSTGRQPTLAAPWASPPSFPCPPPYPPPFPPPYPPVVHVPGWPPMGMHSSPHWIPPVPACPPWPKAPPGHRSPASGYSPFDVGRDAYKVNNSNIQGPSHRQQT